MGGAERDVLYFKPRSTVVKIGINLTRPVSKNHLEQRGGSDLPLLLFVDGIKMLFLFDYICYL